MQINVTNKRRWPKPASRIRIKGCMMMMLREQKKGSCINAPTTSAGQVWREWQYQYWYLVVVYKGYQCTWYSTVPGTCPSYIDPRAYRYKYRVLPEAVVAPGNAFLLTTTSFISTWVFIPIDVGRGGYQVPWPWYCTWLTWSWEYAPAVIINGWLHKNFLSRQKCMPNILKRLELVVTLIGKWKAFCGVPGPDWMIGL